MKVKYDIKSLGVIGLIKTLWPSKTKKYLMKWLKIINFQGILTFCKFFLKHNCMAVITINDEYCFSIELDDALRQIAARENMRNAEELCIWLDMKDVA